jgi:hypothetical protein
LFRGHQRRAATTERVYHELAVGDFQDSAHYLRRNLAGMVGLFIADVLHLVYFPPVIQPCALAAGDAFRDAFVIRILVVLPFLVEVGLAAPPADATPSDAAKEASLFRSGATVQLSMSFASPIFYSFRPATSLILSLERVAFCGLPFSFEPRLFDCLIVVFRHGLSFVVSRTITTGNNHHVSIS